MTRHLPASTTGRAAAARLALPVVLAALSGCAGSATEPVGYEPVEDERLFSEVEDLPGVRSADITWDSTFTNGAVYSGTVRLDRRVDPVETLDEVTAILWQDARTHQSSWMS